MELQFVVTLNRRCVANIKFAVKRNQDTEKNNLLAKVAYYLLGTDKLYNTALNQEIKSQPHCYGFPVFFLCPLREERHLEVSLHTEFQTSVAL